MEELLRLMDVAYYHLLNASVELRKGLADERDLLARLWDVVDDVDALRRQLHSLVPGAGHRAG